MSFQLQLCLVIVLAVGGIIAGRRLAAHPRYWLIGFVLPLVVVGLVILGRRVISLSFMPPISWVTSGRASFAIMAPVCTLLLSTLIPKLRIPRQRVAIWVFMGVMVLNFSILPLIAPMVVRGALLAKPTKIDEKGVCRQTHDYTCGPAAAVTALRRVGIQATESELAILASTSPAAGTDADLLAAAINQRYATTGVQAAYRLFNSIDDLKSAAPSVALMHFSLFVDHYVAVLEVTPTGVLIGDPLGGEQLLTRQQFAKNWRGSAIVVSRR
jgi:predicted double-glycine peptidase